MIPFQLIADVYLYFDHESFGMSRYVLQKVTIFLSPEHSETATRYQSPSVTPAHALTVQEKERLKQSNSKRYKIKFYPLECLPAAWNLFKKLLQELPHLTDVFPVIRSLQIGLNFQQSKYKEFKKFCSINNLCIRRR